jgi:hypothetical protein
VDGWDIGGKQVRMAVKVGLWIYSATGKAGSKTKDLI